MPSPPQKLAELIGAQTSTKTLEAHAQTVIKALFQNQTLQNLMPSPPQKLAELIGAQTSTKTLEAHAQTAAKALEAHARETIEVFDKLLRTCFELDPLKEITQITDFEANIQAKIKIKCSCGHHKIETTNFKLIIEKSDDYSDFRKSKPDYPHQSWKVLFRSDPTLVSNPVSGRDHDLIKAYKEARENLQKFINENN